MKKVKNNKNGFTIIEVLIVLAIAGLILLIVFLAVPALQRNSRNTQRKNDVQSALGSIQEGTNNNNGKLPASVSAAVANAKFGYFDATDFTGSTTNSTAVATITPNDNGVIINNFTKCPSTVPPAGGITTNSNATSRSVTAIYKVETSGGFQNQCLDL